MGPMKLLIYRELWHLRNYFGYGFRIFYKFAFEFAYFLGRNFNK